MKTHKTKLKLQKVKRIINHLDFAISELSEEVKKTFGENWFATIVEGDGVVIANIDKEEQVCSLDMIISAIDNGTYTEPESYGI